MVNLHLYYHNGNFKAFRQELDGSGGSTYDNTSGSGGGGGSSSKGGGGGVSYGRSWTGGGGISVASTKGDPNERDQFGRTVLHLAAASNTSQAYTFLGILLRNSHISVNLQDYESGYTALHRAMFSGNIRAARDLLTRNDIDPSIKDFEGLTAFDLYNGTVDGTNPSQGAEGSDLYVWGVNRNFALGSGDSSDKAFPDRVNLLTQNQASDKVDPGHKFDHVGVREVVMAKLHTGVITAEARGNLSLCGFGTNGRLGRSVHSELALKPLPHLPHTITALALAQDHTLALTSGGYILSWGHNRFSQLGYVIEPPENPMPGRTKEDDLVQSSPRRIVGPLKKEWVKGVASGRMSSACWTSDAIWTWGTNAGHLGYEKAANPVQILPRKVTAISQPVIDVALSDYAMICLLDTFEVICFHHDANFRINFSTPRVLSETFPFRPPQSTIKPIIEKVTSCGTTFAALSSIGDVFTFSLPNPAEDVSKDGRDRHVTVKPQLIWALRKSFTAVKDVALGSDGTVIICTHSGHVFVRRRVKAGAGQLKFKRIPYLQRVIKVACNESGAFAAIRVDAKPTPIQLHGHTLNEDMALLQPHLRRFEHQMTAEDFAKEHHGPKADDEDEDQIVNPVTSDIAMASRLCTILRRWRANDTDSLFSWSEPLLGSDVDLVVDDMAIPAHILVLCIRAPVFTKVLNGKKVTGFSLDTIAGLPRIKISACHPLVVLLLLQYIYSDEVAAVWDARVTQALMAKFSDLSISINKIKSDLISLAHALELAPLSKVLESTAKVPIPKPMLSQDLQSFFIQTSLAHPILQDCDVTLILADKEVHCSSVILRARCPFFEAMFEDGEWTTARHENEEGNIVISMEHLKWRPMQLVFKYIHEGLEENLFDYLHQETLDDFLDFVFEVLAAATELLLDRLVLVCSQVIIKHCNAYNAAALACEAAFYQATTLKLSVFDYIISSMETMMESGLLDDMHEDVLLELCSIISQKQNKKLSVSRTGMLVKPAMERQKEWLSMQDLPSPIFRTPYKRRIRSPMMAPADRNLVSPSPSPLLTPSQATNTIEEIFSMDDDIHTPSTGSGAQTPRATSRPHTPMDILGSARNAGGPVWKSRTVETERVDLRSIMAETAARSTKTPIRPPISRGTSANPATSSSPLSTPSKLPPTGKSPPSSGAWRTMTPAKPAAGPAPNTPQSQGSSRGQPSSAFPTLGTPSSANQNSPMARRTSANNVITPIKLQPAPAGAQRKPSTGPAWSTSTTFAPTPVVPSASPDTKAFSLLAIQREEQNHAERSTKKPIKSFAEIQAEEKEAEVKKKEELEIQRWWAEEQSKNKAVNGEASSDRGRGRGRGRGARGRGGPGGEGRVRGQRKVPPQRGTADRGRGRGVGAGTPNEARGGGRGGRGGGRGGGGVGGGEVERGITIGNAPPTTSNAAQV